MAGFLWARQQGHADTEEVWGPGYRVFPVDALAISRRAGLGRIVNSALLGAFARVLAAPPLAALERVIAERSPRLTEENLAACRDGYRTVDTLLAGAAA